MEEKIKRFPVTYALIGICVLVFCYTTLKYGIDMSASDAIRVGAYNPQYVSLLHEYYRLITANLLHFGIMHIFCNCYSLMNLGTVMEHLLGVKRYAIVLVVSSFATTFIPYLLYLFTGIGASSVMGGISGAIFGLMGALLALAWKFKDVYMYLFKQISSSIIVMLLISFMVPSISLSGHISGMVGGFVIMLVIIKYMPLNSWKRNRRQNYSNLVN